MNEIGAVLHSYLTSTKPSVYTSSLAPDVFKKQGIPEIINSYKSTSIMALKDMPPLEMPSLKPILEGKRKMKKPRFRLNSIKIPSNWLRTVSIAFGLSILLLGINEIRKWSWNNIPYNSKYPEKVFYTIPRLQGELAKEDKSVISRRVVEPKEAEPAKKQGIEKEASKQDAESKEDLIKPTASQAFIQNISSLTNEVKDEKQSETDRVERLEAIGKSIVVEWSRTIVDGDIKGFIALFSDPAEYLDFGKISKDSSIALLRVGGRSVQ